MKKQYTIRIKTRSGKTITGRAYDTKKEAVAQINEYKSRGIFKDIRLVYREVSEWKEA